MICFESNKDNGDYLMVKPWELACFDMGEEVYASDFVKQKINKLYYTIFPKYSTTPTISFNKDTTIAIRKDSVIGNWLIDNENHFDLYNKDLDISYVKVVNALNIAIFSDNRKMANKIMPLFINQISGIKNKLSNEYCEEAINYIIENDDFDTFLLKFNGDYEEKKVVVYEDGELSHRILSQIGQKVKKKV